MVSLAPGSRLADNKSSGDVPEGTTQLVMVPVQVLNDSGLPSNAVNLTVIARQADGQVTGASG